MSGIFQKIARAISNWMGQAWTFILAIGTIVVWAITGPFFGYTDTWQLIINTGTTIVTFLMVFLIQNTQNRDTKALQLKLDELILSTSGARNKLIDLEDLSDEEMETLHLEFCELKKHFEEKAELINERRKHRHSHKNQPRS